VLRTPRATTKVAGVIGDPVDHSLSPALHNAAFTATKIDWVYVAFPVPRGRGSEAVSAMRTLGLAGLSVTMPHKAAVVERVDRLGPVAARLGVANTISWSQTAPGELVGDSTDGPGFIDALHGDDGVDPRGRSCAVFGAGGAARAVTLALADAGAAAVAVVARRAEEAKACAELAPSIARPVGTDAASVEEVVTNATVLVNATPLGMSPGDGLPFDMRPEWISSRHYVADLIYSPATTPMLGAARRAGAGCTNGLGMLIHQAARQFEIWTGRPAPLEEMSAAALGALGHRGRQAAL
jgi:shikimate dehydrogenase